MDGAADDKIFTTQLPSRLDLSNGDRIGPGKIALTAALPPRVTADDRNAHRAFVDTLGSEAVRLDYFTIKSAAA